MMKPENTEPGWKTDPDDPDHKRFWNGSAWTGRLVTPEDTQKTRSDSAGRANPTRAEGVPAPTPTPTPTPTLSDAADIDYASLGRPTNLGRISIVAYVFLGLSLLGAVGALAKAFSQRSLISDVSTLNQLTLQKATDFDALATSASRLMLASLLFGAIGFIPFFVVSYGNAMKLGARGYRYSSGWALGSWFIPIWSFFRPKQVANDLWKSSTAFDPKEPSRWRTASVAKRVHIWWTLWIASLVLLRIDAAYYDSAMSLDSLVTSSTISVVTYLVCAIGISLAIAIVSGIIARQRLLLEHFDLATSPVIEPDLKGDPAIEASQAEMAVDTSDASPQAQNGALDQIAKLGELQDKGFASDEESTVRDCAECGASLRGPYCSKCGAKTR